MRAFLVCLSTLMIILSLASPSSPQASSKPASSIAPSLLQGTIYKYQVFLPESWTPKQKWPIILFLHGYGERGSDGLLQTESDCPTRFARIVPVFQPSSLFRNA